MPHPSKEMGATHRVSEAPFQVRLTAVAFGAYPLTLVPRERLESRPPCTPHRPENSHGQLLATQSLTNLTCVTTQSSRSLGLERTVRQQLDHGRQEHASHH